MIKKTLLVTFSALALYSLFLFFLPKKYSIPQGQQQLNVITAQKYLYNKENKDHVIVGSSLSAKISKSVLPANFYNLALRGRTSCDGLEIIKRSGKIPKVILIEVNSVYRKPSKQFCDDLFMKGMYEVKSFIPALQEEHEPVNTFSYIMSLPFVDRSKNLASKLGSDDVKVSYKEVLKDSTSIKVMLTNQEREVSKKLISERRYKESKLPDGKILQQRILTLKNYITYFKTKGVKVIFFEMPINEELALTKTSVFIRENFEKEFDKKSYAYINTPNRKMFKTKDGSHLVEESAEYYTAYMLNEFLSRNL